MKVDAAKIFEEMKKNGEVSRKIETEDGTLIFYLTNPDDCIEKKGNEIKIKLNCFELFLRPI